MVTLSEAAGMALGFVLFVVVVSIGGTILQGIRASQYTTSVNTSCTDALAAGGQLNCTTVAWNATNAGLSGITNLASQNGTLGTIIAASVLIGIVLGAFYLTKSQ